MNIFLARLTICSTFCAVKSLCCTCRNDKNYSSTENFNRNILRYISIQLLYQARSTTALFTMRIRKFRKVLVDVLRCKKLVSSEYK